MRTATTKTAGIWLMAALLYAGQAGPHPTANANESQNNPQGQTEASAQDQQQPPSAAPPLPQQSLSAQQQAELEREQQRARRAQIAAYRRAQRQVHAAQREARSANQVSALHRVLNPWSPQSVSAYNQSAQAYQNAAQNLAGYMGARTTSPYYDYYFHVRGW